MTISNTTASITHLGNGVNTLWAYGFKIPDASSAVVTVIDADAIETVLDPTAFSISGVGSGSGGVVTYPLTGSPLANGYSIRIDRSVALTQTTGFSNQSGLINSLIESAFDKLTMIAQDTKALSARVTAASQSVLGYVSIAAGYATQAAASAAYAAGVAAGNAVLFTEQTLTSGQKTQAQTNIGLAAVAASGSYDDLTGKPPLGTAAALDVGAGANKVVQRDASGLVPSIGGSVTVDAAGNYMDFVGIPATAKRVTIVFSGLSATGSAILWAQLGTSGGIQSSGYEVSANQLAVGGNVYYFTSGIGFTYNFSSGLAITGSIRLDLVDGASGLWAITGTVWYGSAAIVVIAGYKALAGVLDRIRVGSTGADTMDAGKIKVTWEG